MAFHEEGKRILDQIEEGQRTEDKAALAIQAKLLSRLMLGYTPIPFKGPEGTFYINLRIPSPKERQNMWQLQAEIIEATKQNDHKALEKLGRQVAEALTALCPEVPVNMWMDGETYGVDITEKLLRIIMGIDPQEVENIQFFRVLPAGSGLRRDAQVDRSKGAE